MKALVGAFSVITNLQMELFGALANTLLVADPLHLPVLPEAGVLAEASRDQVPGRRTAIVL